MSQVGQSENEQGEGEGEELARGSAAQEVKEAAAKVWESKVSKKRKYAAMSEDEEEESEEEESEEEDNSVWTELAPGEFAEMFGRLPAKEKTAVARQLAAMLKHKPSQEPKDSLSQDLGDLLSQEAAGDQAVVEKKEAGKQGAPTQKALDQYFKKHQKLGPHKTSRSQQSDVRKSKELAMVSPAKKGGRPKKAEWAKRSLKGRVPQGVRRMRTEPGAVQALAYLAQYRELAQEKGSKNKALQLMVKELRCSPTYIKNLEKRESKLRAKAAEVGKNCARKQGNYIVWGENNKSRQSCE